ncbi:MAG: metal ABC transporter permease [Bacteroidales bacterium]
MVGWAMGVVASFLGLWFSVKWDVPSSPVIIVLLGVILLVSFTLFKAVRLTRSS